MPSLIEHFWTVGLPTSCRTVVSIVQVAPAGQRPYSAAARSPPPIPGGWPCATARPPGRRTPHISARTQGRHAGDALVGGLLRLRAISAVSSSPARRLRISSAVQPAIGPPPAPHFSIGEIAAVGKYNTISRCFMSALARLPPVDQPVAIDRIGLTLDPIRAVRQAFPRPRRRHAAGHAW